jgi:outer membrane protein OmpA-like peptidoglycan-associated protein
VKILLLLLFTAFNSALFGQRSTYNNCSGAVFAPIEGSFSLSFLGEKKNNQMWVVFIAPKSGKFEIDFTSISSSLNFVKGVIYLSDEEWCNLTPLQKSQSDSIAFEIRGQQVVKDIVLEKNQYATICIKNQPGLKDLVLFKSAFVATIPSEDEQTLDLTYDTALPIYTLVLRDRQTLAPVTGRIILQGAAEVNGTYFASQLNINLKQPIKKGMIKVEATGYFPVEFKEHRIPLGTTYKDTIYLNGFKTGELTKLEQVYFSAGLPEIMEESYPQLNRLRDLLLLNPQINIEIHGHVNLDENSAKKAQKLSKQRAEMVKKYLVESGVSAKRLYPIGFGSSKPVYSKPKDESEKEANRRVEILIKEN